MLRVSHQGFWTVKRGTPYSLDEVKLAHHDLTVSRMDAYLGLDFACYTDMQRDEYG